MFVIPTGKTMLVNKNSDWLRICVGSLSPTNQSGVTKYGDENESKIFHIFLWYLFISILNWDIFWWLIIDLKNFCPNPMMLFLLFMLDFIFWVTRYIFLSDIWELEPGINKFFFSLTKKTGYISASCISVNQSKEMTIEKPNTTVKLMNHDGSSHQPSSSKVKFQTHNESWESFQNYYWGTPWKSLINFVLNLTKSEVIYVLPPWIIMWLRNRKPIYVLLTVRSTLVYYLGSCSTVASKS